MTKKIFITATGTDIGKTYVSALIVKKMRDSGYNCGYFKPVLSGVQADNGKLIVSDCNYVIDFAKIPSSAEDCVGYWWQEAVSPHLAAQRVNQKIEIDNIKNDLEKISKNFEYLLIEGAGGITCPLRVENNERYLLSDLIKDLNVNILIVADAGLGTINSTLLTVEFAHKYGIKTEGIILNNFDANSFMHQDNLKQVEYLTDIKVVATVKKEQKEITLLKDLFKE